jgi:flagellar protein FliS
MSAETNPANAYLRTKVMTASPEELRLMLLDGAIKFARQGREGLVKRDFEASYNGISQSRDIVLELLMSIRTEHDPELLDRIKAVYTFMYSEMISASMEKSVPKLDGVIKLLEYERETWSLLMGQLIVERAAAKPRSAQASATTEPRPAISVQA